MAEAPVNRISGHASPAAKPANHCGPKHPLSGVKRPTTMEGAGRAVTGGDSFPTGGGSEADRRLDNQTAGRARVFRSGPIAIRGVKAHDKRPAVGLELLAGGDLAAAAADQAGA